MKRFLSIVLSALLFSVSLFSLLSCKEDTIPTKEYAFSYHDIEAVNYEIFLGSLVDKRVVRIPLVFDYELPETNIECDIIGVKDNLGDDLSEISVDFKSLSFTTDDDTKFLIANIDMEIKLSAMDSFSTKIIKTVLVRLAGKDFSCRVNIQIKNRSSFGVYRNINKQLMPSDNIGTFVVYGSTFQEHVGAECNDNITINKICYSDKIQISGFDFFKYSGDDPTHLSIENNLHIDQEFNRNDVFSASWEIVPNIVADKYFGREVLIFYTLNKTREEFVDSYFRAFCYYSNLYGLIGV